MIPILLALALSGPALANGQVSHLWISQTAIELLPPGELRDLMSDPAHEDMWRNGSMFPDGGYAVGDGYGETAHWEPFHNAYTAWIRAEYGGPPYSGEAAEHVAFLMGMTSHGMADQVYDSLYMERAHQEDADQDWGESMDEATDVAMASMVGPVDHGELWVPDELMAQLMAQDMGHEVSASTIRTGQAMVRLVPVWAANVIEQPEYVDAYFAQFPWACAHQIDPQVWGNPPDEAEVVARYWQEIWGRLSGVELAVGPVLATFPADGTQGWETDAEKVTSRVTTIAAWSLQHELVPDLPLTIQADDGSEPPLDRWVFYSHVLHAAPQQDWADTTDYTVSVPADLPSKGGLIAAPASTEPLSYSFTTGPIPQILDPEPETGCSSQPRRALGAWLWLLVLGASARRQRSG